MLKVEIKKLFHTKMIYISILLGVIACSFGLIRYYDDVYIFKAVGEPSAITAYNAWLSCLSGGSSLYRIVVPLLIVPFLGSYFVERKSGYQNFLPTRCSRLKYFCSKLAVGIGSAILIVAVTLVITLAVCLFLFPANDPRPEFTFFNDQRLNSFYVSNPIVCICVLITLNMFFASLYYSIGFGLSCFVKNRYILMMIPFILFVAQLVIWETIDIPWLCPLIFIAPYEAADFSIGNACIAAAVLILASIILLVNCYRKDKQEVI